ncbi:F-box/LRR-repeat protein 14-like [Zingiber officinale]|uniref:COI1 F-box domain-containing protein n=1 Tax=Zingiber officinale TaxID=94328 RepID=A0A8J5GSH1_ZINOF|nr:F-box/LRR-repeat protein 14-like [Zingiber officinale]XP_042382661.1 F-box/LRR-repeat protein 14-like [Zingiber officinale]XP_042382663.1 F-box/LRR-repeat protein 14-like [Zingiber officinale]XP_042382664.1 F-box/LRR-repeat protein 14-like [Zingiber officinale]XP_042382665.1 F-box/LRR-repeat protein 14-like [Zingiber officinale]XP_042382666.1 F-box/LRR-repeat protein 14-like [Zingiber officinale]XP_042382667.1 F-box/LRR-repeat protein 14-like [Zingiber officinale]XP_042382668.1 F-box/LRR-
MGLLVEDFPKELLVDIVKRIERTADRNSISLVCKRLYEIDREQRDFLKVGSGLHPATEALTALCLRFANIKKLEITYFGWMSNSGKQLDNQGLFVLCSNCPLLTELTLSFCSFINDSGLAYLSSCPKLRSLKLNFAQSISSNGILSLVVGCKNLSALHLIRCMRVTSVEWLAYLGQFGKLQDLSIKYCKGISEDDMIKLGPGWNNLRQFEFEMDAYYRHPKVYDNSLIEKWANHLSCENLRELILVNCILPRSRGLCCLLWRCEALIRLNLDMCIGVKDSDMIALSQKSRNLRSISIRIPSRYFVSSYQTSSLRLSDESLTALSIGCLMLEVFELSFSDGEFPSLSCLTQSGILTLIQSCPIRILVLDSTCFFNDIGMEALSTAPYLQTLKLVKCQEVTDEGMQLIACFPCLTTLSLCKCLGITDDGFKLLIGLHKLDLLMVEDCPQISEDGVQRAARVVSYKQDLSWLY